ncbi:type IV pilus biogenesis protein PilM [Paenibacillus koleovorans]|uniref:type IV pilus biogenesis protein PilM n=1 Tax=Paenibacillus koleovorans TaxID=121608 RepID=UPI000FDBCA40|nr:pilus assembly protein PilM [Paenibacillus koleovorans]
MFGKKQSKYAYGMQISDTSAKLVEIMNTPGQVIVTQRHSIALDRGSIKNGKFVDEESVIARIGSIVRQLGLQGEKVNVTVPLSNVILRRSVFSSLKDKELRNMIDVELHGGQTLPFKDPVFDFVRLGAPKDAAAPAAEEGKKAPKASQQEEVLIFATPSEMVNSYGQVVKKTGLIPVSVDLAPLALHRMMIRGVKLTGEAMRERFMLLYVEPDHADISIFVGGIPVFFRSLQINTSYFMDTGTDPIAAYGRNLAMELGRVLNYFQYTVSTDQEHLQTIYLVGEHEWIRALPEHLEGAFPGEIAPFPLGDIIQGNDDASHAYAVPVGLAMKGA